MNARPALSSALVAVVRWTPAAVFLLTPALVDAQQRARLGYEEIQANVVEGLNAIESLSLRADLAVDGREFASYDVLFTPEECRIVQIRPAASAVLHGRQVRLSTGFEERLVITPSEVLRYHPARAGSNLVAASIVSRLERAASHDVKPIDWRLLGKVPTPFGGMYRRGVQDVMSLSDVASTSVTWEHSQDGQQQAVCRVTSATGRQLTTCVLPNRNWFVASVELATGDGKHVVRVASQLFDSGPAAGSVYPRLVRYEAFHEGKLSQVEICTIKDVRINPEIAGDTFGLGALGLPKGYPVIVNPGGDSPIKTAVWTGRDLETTTIPGEPPVGPINSEPPLTSDPWRVWLILSNLLAGTVLGAVYLYRRMRRAPSDVGQLHA